MAEKQILGVKPAWRLEQIDEQHSQRVQDCKHPRKSCDDSASRGESRPDGIFGKDKCVIGAGVRRNRMIAEPKQQPHHKDRSKRERRRDEKALDEALKNAFPASDPVSVEQPALPAAHTQLSPANLNS
jgi:hypothetical protein